MNNNFTNFSSNFSSDDEEDAPFSSEGLASLYVLENQMAYNRKEGIQDGQFITLFFYYDIAYPTSFM